MHIFHYLLALFISVGAMTMFSAIMSIKFKSEFKEHVLLSKLISNKSLKQKESAGHLIFGWFLHFLIGGFFLVIYKLLWNYTELIQSVLGSVLYGVLIGIIGVAGWFILFKLDSHPPDINYKVFYFQLIIAHVFFSLGNFSIFLFQYKECLYYRIFNYIACQI
ncbi:hypothetical protein ACFSKN_14450 [Mariniflexile gromovii]|uniref:Uncharacterized protein n=1 Tax=Mariniflexile gromovii TaxID=362523 RepID=A0ABS4BRH0_9FLAO|nr:hypothetical protein [Mariniflexile gromovii]MBP0903171.1 hypothetical protein [Mariniflexile gromovii]